MKNLLLATAAAALLGLPLQAAPSQPATPAVAEPGASKALADLFAASDEANLRRNPVGALFRGDMRYADKLGDAPSPAYYEAERTAAEQELAALARIDRSKLGVDEQISYDVFKWQRELDLRGLQPDMLALTAVRPIDHFNGVHTFFAELSGG